MRFVQQAPDDINWTIDHAEFHVLLALKKDSASGPDGIPYGVYRCAGGLGSKFLFRAYQAVLEGSNIPDCFAESRTVFIPKTSDTDDLGRIILSPDALRPLTLCNCDCKLLTSAFCRGLHWYTVQCIHPSQRCISSGQMTDNIFEIETTALAHVACAKQNSGVLLTDFAAARQICWNYDWPKWTPSSLDGTLENFIQRVMKINASTKSLVEQLCDFKIYAISVLSFIGSVCAPDKATLKAENHALQCTTAGPYNAIPSSLLQVGSICELGPDLVGIHSLSLAARHRVAACSSTLRRGREKVNEARGHNCTPLFALSPAWEQELLFPSMTFHTT